MKNKHILITGGTKGIGSTIARYFGDAGTIVSVIGRTQPEKINRNEKNIVYFQADISDVNQVNKVLHTILKTRGKFSHLIFTQRYRGTGDTWSGEWEVSLSATKNIIELCVNEFDQTPEKSIVIIGSVLNSFVALDQPLGYHVAKTALLSMVRYYAVTLGNSGIRVNSVSPGAVFKERAKPYYEKHKTLTSLYQNIIPLKKIGTPENIAGVVGFLCSPDSLYITGQDIVVDGGFSLLAQEGLSRKITSDILGSDYEK